jgi:hypothetical protein
LLFQKAFICIFIPRAVNIFWHKSHVAWSFSFDCTDFAEDLTDLTLASTDFNDADDEIDELVIAPTFSKFSRKLSVIKVSNGPFEASLTVRSSYSSSPSLC